VNAETLQVILTSAVVSAIVTGVLGPTVVFILQAREERRRREFDVRFQEYRKYVQALEDMSAAWTEKSVRYLQEVLDGLDAIVEESGEPAQHLKSMNRLSGEVPGELLVTFSRVKKELAGLRLVCSDPLLQLVDEFVSMYDTLVAKLIAFVNSFTVEGQVQISLSEILNESKRADELKRKIIQRMRKELRIGEGRT